MVGSLKKAWWAAAGALLLNPLVFASPAHADTATNYGLENEYRICKVFSQYPNAQGVIGIAQAIIEETGFTPQQAGEAIAAGIIDYCPGYYDDLMRIVAISQHNTGGKVA
jgi:hypothetical protein